MNRVIIITIYIFSIISIFSEEVDYSTLSKKKILKLIDNAIDNKDENLIAIMGGMGPDFKDYAEYEEYILGKAVSLMQTDDLNFPLMLVEAVLYNNLDNKDAQELYSIIVDKNIEIEERIKAEEERDKIRRENIEEISEELDKDVNTEEQLSSIASGYKDLELIVNNYTNSYYERNYVSSNYFYPFITKNYTSEVYDGFIERDQVYNHYNGQSVELGFGIDLGKIKFRLDFNGNMTYNNLFNEVQRQIFSSVYTSIGLKKIPFPVYSRFGFIYDSYLYNDSDFSDVAITTLPSPVIGLGVSGYQFLSVFKADLSSDFILASLYTDNLTYGLNNRVYLTINLLRVSSITLEIRGGFDSIFLKEDDLSEFSITPKIGFGFSSYE